MAKVQKTPTVKNQSLHKLIVRTRPGNRAQGLLSAGNRVFACALGRSGIAAIKLEGDGGTPIGSYPLVSAYVRADRSPIRFSPLGLDEIPSNLGWCEVPGDANYNRPVKLPYPVSHERMRRDDHLYDYVVVLDQNFSCRMRNRGSAIFFHLARSGFTPTEGCVAVERKAMEWLLPRISPQTRMVILG